ERILSKGLTPVFFIQDDADIEAAALAPAAGALLVSPAFHGPIAVPALAETLSRGGWAAFSNGGPESSLGSLSRSWRIRWLEAPLPPGQALLAGETGISEGEAGLRRELLRGNELILARLDPARGVEWNFERLRQLTGALRRAFPAGIPASAGGRKLLPAPARAALFWLAAMLAVLGTTLAMRAGLDAVRKVCSRTAFLQASPLLETACGLAVAAAVSALTGLAAHAALSVREWRLGIFPPGLETVVFLLTSAVGVAALFPLDPRLWSRGTRGEDSQAPPMRPNAFPKGTQGGEDSEPPMARLWTRSLFIRIADAALFMTAAALIVSPAWTQGSALASVAAVFAIRPHGQGLFLRQAEAAIGQAALFVGFWTYCVQLRRQRGEADRTAEPKENLRPWLLLGLLALAGSALSFLRLPIDQAVRGTLAAAALGAPLGLLAVAFRLLRSAVDVPNIRNP
ncbi:MAG: hypothetical protein HY922_02980, partial [Elusimicrobia bacterium]|nr:hypothetical protein [Elusimicrobiota bacterium]